jgi:molybdopterin synthase catalytic subunit
MSSNRIIVRVEPKKLDPQALSSLLNVENCGSVVSFVGLTRGKDNDVLVISTLS